MLHICSSVYAPECVCMWERDRGRACAWTWKSDGVSDPGSVIYFTQSKSVSYFALTKCFTSRVAGKRLTVAAAWQRRTIKFLAQIHLELHTFPAASARYALLLKINRAPQTHRPPGSLAPSNKTPIRTPLQQRPSHSARCIRAKLRRMQARASPLLIQCCAVPRNSREIMTSYTGGSN